MAVLFLVQEQHARYRLTPASLRAGSHAVMTTVPSPPWPASAGLHRKLACGKKSGSKLRALQSFAAWKLRRAEIVGSRGPRLTAADNA